MYAIIEDSGTQIKVKQGDVVRVALREMEQGQATLTFDRVLALGSGKEGEAGKIGTPVIAGAKVTADVLAEEKTDRVTATRYRRRKNVLKRRGHRQRFLKVKITSIVA